MDDRNYYAEAVADLDRAVRDVKRLLGWGGGDCTEERAATLADMGQEVDVDATDDAIAEAAYEALNAWPLGVDKHEVYTITFTMNGPTVYAEIDVSDGEVTGGRWVTSAPGFGQSAPTQTVEMREGQADAFAAAFLPELG